MSIFPSYSSSSSSPLNDGLVSSLRQLYALGSAEFKDNLSRLAFSSATVLRDRLLSSSTSLINSAHVLTGDTHNHVGKRLCNNVSPTVTLDKVHYCVTSLSFLQSIANSSEVAKAAEVSDGANAKEIRSLINHAFLVVEMYDENTKQPLFFRADKFGGPVPDFVGIFIDKFDRFPLLRKGVVAFTLSCDKKAVTVKQVMEILEGGEGDADYCLRDRCCWDYARETAEKLLRVCAALPSLSQQENARLQKELDSVEVRVVKQSLKNVPFIVEKYFEWVKENVSSAKAKITFHDLRHVS